MLSAWKERKIIKFVLQFSIMNFICKYKFFCLFINVSVRIFVCQTNDSKRMHGTSSLSSTINSGRSCRKTVKKCASASFLGVFHDGRQVCVFKFSSENARRMKIENSIFIQILCIGYFWLISVIRTQQPVVHGNRQSLLNCAETRRTFDECGRIEMKTFSQAFLPVGTDIRLVRGRGDTGMCPHQDICQISKHQVMTFVSILPGRSCWAAEGKCGETENLPLPRPLLWSKYINWNIWHITCSRVEYSDPAPAATPSCYISAHRFEILSLSLAECALLPFSTWWCV